MNAFKNLLLALVMVVPLGLSAQLYEVGIQVGGSNLVGDIGRTSYIYPRPYLPKGGNAHIPVYFNALFKLNFNPYQSLRLNLGYTSVYFNDLLAKEDYRRKRRVNGKALEGENNMFIGEALFEYNFRPINFEQRDGMLSPYIFGGLGLLIYDQPVARAEHSFYGNDTTGPVAPATADLLSFSTPDQPGFKTTFLTGKKKGSTLAIPFGAGLKYKFNYNWTIFGELLFRPTFADDLDFSRYENKNVQQVFPKGTDLNETDFQGESLRSSSSIYRSVLQDEPYKTEALERIQPLLDERNIGNLKSKDWINTISIGISYSFGRPPCYCEQ